MGKGRLAGSQAEARDRVEAALAALATAVVELEEIRLRIQQAQRRSGLVEDVLRPAEERVNGLMEDVRTAQREMGEVWARGQVSKWR